MAKIAIDKNGNLVTKLKKVWISCDDDGSNQITLYSTMPIYVHNSYYCTDGKGTYIGDNWSCCEIVFWFKANIRNSKNGPLLNALPEPGELWEVELI